MPVCSNSPCPTSKRSPPARRATCPTACSIRSISEISPTFSRFSNQANRLRLTRRVPRNSDQNEMLTVDLQTLAVRQLADFDARTPNRVFADPIELSIAESYEIQNEVALLRERRGEKIIGYKVGCTSPAIQEQLGIREPIFGRLFD